MPRLESIYVWYGWTVALLLAVCGRDVPGRWLWCAGHAAIVVPALVLPRLGLAIRYVAACALVPAAFSILGSIIPDLVPEPFHWRVAVWDAAIGGTAVAAIAQAPPAWLVEVCQLCYSTFYFLPIALGVVFIARGRLAAAEHTAELIVGGFLLSYLGYITMPTLPPYRFVSYPAELAGGPAFDYLNPLLYELEALRQDCMPSGHTMMTLLTCALAWRYDRRQLSWLGPISAFLLLGTVVLRYHWFVDCLAGAGLALVAWLVFRRNPRSVGQHG